MFSARREGDLSTRSLNHEFAELRTLENGGIDTVISGNLSRLRWDQRIARKTSPVSGLRPSTLRFYSVTAFLVGFLQPLAITLVGKLLISELLLLVVLVHSAVTFALARVLPVSIPSPRTLIFLLICQLLALLSYIVSDLWHQSLPFDMIRGWLRMIFLLVDTFVLALLFGAGIRPFVLLLVGLSFSSLLTFLEGPLFGDYWKFCFGYPLTIVILLSVPRLLGFWATVAASLALGVLHLLMEYRSLGIQCLLLAGLLLSRSLPPLFRKYLFIMCIPIAFVGLPWTLSVLLADTEGSANRSNVERSAMLTAAWEGFLASPWVGNGSWFSKSNVWDNFLLIRSQKEIETGGKLGFDPHDFGGKAIHSQILTALAEGGLLGGTFFLAYTVLLILGFWFLLTEASWHWLMPIRLSILISSFCAVFMSPFSGTSRLEIGMAAALVVVLLDERKALLLRSASPSPGPKRPRVSAPLRLSKAHLTRRT